MATVEYVEGLYWYTAGETREVGGVTHVRYLFDEASSDETEGTADQQAESRQL